MSILKEFNEYDIEQYYTVHTNTVRLRKINSKCSRAKCLNSSNEFWEASNRRRHG